MIQEIKKGTPIRQSDIEEFAGLMLQLRRTGMTPSKIIDEVWSDLKDYVMTEFPEIAPHARFKLCAYLLEESAKTAGIHSQMRREGKEATKNA